MILCFLFFSTSLCDRGFITDGSSLCDKGLLLNVLSDEPSVSATATLSCEVPAEEEGVVVVVVVGTVPAKECFFCCCTSILTCLQRWIK